MSDDIKVIFDSPEKDLQVNLDAGAIMYGKLKVGTTTTGPEGTAAKVENVGSNVNAILNFTIPRGDKGDRGEQGIQGVPGLDGADGLGVPAGGATGQVLAKKSANDNDTEWVDFVNGVKEIPANTNVDEFHEEGIYAWNGDDGKAITGLPATFSGVDIPQCEYILKVTKLSSRTTESGKLMETYEYNFSFAGILLYTQVRTVYTTIETGHKAYADRVWRKIAMSDENGLVVSSTKPTIKTEKSKVWLQKNKNLLNLSSFGTKTISGVTFTNNGNGTITINGTASASFGVNFVKLNLKAGTYHLSVNANTSHNFYIYDYDSNTNILSKEATATLTKSYNNIGFDTYINSGEVFDNLTISPQLEVGSSASAFGENATSAIYTKESNNKYEKFSETVAISSEEPINQNGLWLQKGKNLVSKESFENITIENGTPVSNPTRLSTVDYVFLKAGQYTFSCNLARGLVQKFDVNKSFLETIVWTEFPFSFNLETDGYVKLSVIKDYNGAENVSKTDITYLQLEQGSTATEYEEYKDKKIYTKTDNGVYEEFANLDEPKNDYSLAETKIGTWINGKPVYRKVIETNTQTVSLAGYNIYAITSYKVISAFSNGLLFNEGRYNSAEDFYTYYINTQNMTLNIDIGSKWINDYVSSTLIIEYTKTTDVATTSSEE